MKKILMLAGVLAFLSACDDNKEEVKPDKHAIDLSQGEVAFIYKKGKTVEAFYRGKQVTLELIEGQYVLSGDILVSEDELSFMAPPAGNGANEESVGRTGGRWPDNTVYYNVSSSLPNKDRVYDAIAHWEANTNLTFVQRTNQSDYITFRSGGGCSSSVGRVGGQQFINLASGCSTGNTIHEIGHAVGLYHEHTRGDRDDFVNVNFNNIQSGYEHNFYTYIQRGTDGKDYTSSLDFGSIMLYSSYAFSSNGQPTITKLDGSTFSTQRSQLSTDDINGVNQMYPSDGGDGGSEEYINGNWYTIDGVRVYRYYDKWWYYTESEGWREVVNVDGTWYYA